MEMITIYAVVCGNEVITTTKNEKHAIEQADILNKVNKTDTYKVVPCNGVIILN